MDLVAPQLSSGQGECGHEWGQLGSPGDRPAWDVDAGVLGDLNHVVGLPSRAVCWPWEHSAFVERIGSRRREPRTEEGRPAGVPGRLQSKISSKPLGSGGHS